LHTKRQVRKPSSKDVKDLAWHNLWLLIMDDVRGACIDKVMDRIDLLIWRDVSPVLVNEIDAMINVSSIVDHNLMSTIRRRCM